MAREQNAPELPAADSEKTTRLTVQVVDSTTKKPIYNEIGIAHV